MTNEPGSATLNTREGEAGPCLDEATTIAFYSGELDAARAEGVRHHLAECRSCLELARDARRFLEAMDAGAAEAAAPVAHGSRTRLWPLAAAACVTLAVGWWWLRQPTTSGPAPSRPLASSAAPTVRSTRWADLRVPKAPYSPAGLPDDLVWRDDPDDAPRGSEPGAFDRAMQAYARDDLAEAERRLARVLSREPRHAGAHFFHGVCLLIMGRTQDAIASLQRAREYTDGPARDAALYYLALAHLKAGAPDRALPLLEELRGSRRHGKEAERLRQDVVAVLGGRG